METISRPPSQQELYECTTLSIGHMTMSIGHMTMSIGHTTLSIGHMTLSIGHMTMRHVTAVMAI